VREGERRFGKYRGVVADNGDPLELGRVKVKVPSVLDDGTTPWALPAAPFGLFAVPPVGAGVWIEFEAGDPASPIWSGAWWESAADVPLPGKVTLRTAAGHAITLDDAPGSAGVTVQARNGAKVVLRDQRIEITPTSGTRLVLEPTRIELTAVAARITAGPAEVSINNGALQVT